MPAKQAAATESGATSAVPGPSMSAFRSAIKEATSDMKSLAFLLAVLATIPVNYYFLETHINLDKPWPTIFSFGVFVVIFMLYFLPKLRHHLMLRRWVGGDLVDPGYFRLYPYEADQSDTFGRPDGATEDVRRWIEAAEAPIIYLSGRSGVGKTSLINASMVPKLTSGGWVVVRIRPQDAPLDAIKAALLRQSAISEAPPKAEESLRTLIERAATCTQKNSKRLLLVLDPFEEILILCGDEEKAIVAELLCDLVERPVRGLKVLLSLRTEYLKDLPEFGLPSPNGGFGQNAFEIREFKRSEAENFIRGSGLYLAPALLSSILQEAAEIEDMIDRIRPIVINMLGIVITSFKGALPKEVRPGHLLSGYVERRLRDKNVPGVAVKVLRPMITATGTRRALRLDMIAKEADINPNVARGCLVSLANDGLVRRLPGEPEQWEPAHDFVARLLQPILLSWRDNLWQRVGSYLAGVGLALWGIAIIGLVAVYPVIQRGRADAQLQEAGLFRDPALSTKSGSEFVQKGPPLKHISSLWHAVRLLRDRSPPVTVLDLSKYAGGLSLVGMPQLPHLEGLNLSVAQILREPGTGKTRGIKSLQGLPKLKALVWLNLGSNDLTSLEYFPTLPAIRRLYLDNNSIRSLQYFPTLTKLETLHLEHNKISSLQYFPKLPKLQKLDLDSNGIDTLQYLPALPALKTLNLSDNWLFTLKYFHCMPELNTLYLSYNDITSLKSLPKLPKLTVLYLENNNITSLTHISKAPHLKQLFLGNNKLSSIVSLPSLSDLNELGLSGNHINALHAFPVLPGLKALYLGNDDTLTSLKGLLSLKELRFLSLENDSGLVSLKSLPVLPFLRAIDLRYTNVTDLTPLVRLPKLQAIFLTIGRIPSAKIPRSLRDKIHFGSSFAYYDPLR